MHCEQIRAGADSVALAGELRALVPAPESVADTVATIIAAVRDRGDAAILEHTRRFDAPGMPEGSLHVAPSELDSAAAGLEPEIRAGLSLAIENVQRVASAGLREDRAVAFPSHEVILRSAPLARAGIYVPGGRAPYPSTVVMGVVTARVAGVREVAVCAPPSRNGEIDGAVLGACRLAGATTVYRMGGAQAIAALAYGSETVAPVDVIVGPGNLFVQEAKRQVSGQVAIDAFAGPSDLVVIADGDVEPEPLALDLLAQAEHGPGTLVIAISDALDLLTQLSERLSAAPDTGAVARTVLVGSDHEALDLAQALAPEHLQLAGARSEALASQITRAGCLFVGRASGTAFGDYIAGSNHVLPTNGAARFASALSALNFRRTFTEVRIGDASELARAAAPVARAEGFELHAQSMEARIRDNGRR